MNRIFLLFGRSAKIIEIFALTSIGIAFLGAIFPIIFFAYSIISDLNYTGNFNRIIKILLDERHINAIFNSFFIATIFGVLLTFLSGAIALIFRWVKLTGNTFIYGLSVIPLLIPDYVFGIAGRILLDPTIGIMSSVISKSILINKISALFLITICILIKWLPSMIIIADASILLIEQEVKFQIQMDFKSFYKSVLYVYLPEMKKVLLLIGCIGFLIGFRQHELVTELTSSGGGFSAETWSIWNYKELYEFAKITNAVFEAVIVLFLLLIPIIIIKNQAKKLA